MRALGTVLGLGASLRVALPLPEPGLRGLLGEAVASLPGPRDPA